MSEWDRLHLFGPGHSGRAIRYRVLTPDEVEKAEQLAEADVNESTTVLALDKAVVREGLHMMIREVSEPVKPEALPALTAEQWRKVDPRALSTDWPKLFTAKDTKLLQRLYRREHLVTEADLDKLMSGKVRETD